jgi:hypothetical protein
MLDCTIPAMMMNDTEAETKIHEKGNCTFNITLAFWNEGENLQALLARQIT